MQPHSLFHEVNSHPFLFLFSNQVLMVLNFFKRSSNFRKMLQTDVKWWLPLQATATQWSFWTISPVQAFHFEHERTHGENTKEEITQHTLDNEEDWTQEEERVGQNQVFWFFLCSSFMAVHCKLGEGDSVRCSAISYQLSVRGCSRLALGSNVF